MAGAMTFKSFHLPQCIDHGNGGETATLVAGQGKLMRNFPGEFLFRSGCVSSTGSLARKKRRTVTDACNG
jgi:hypothetical protein